MALPETVTSTELGKVLGIGPRQVEQLAKRGILTRLKRGRYSLADSVKGYLDNRISTEVDRVKRDYDGPDTADDEWKRERARAARINNDLKERTLIPIEDAMAAVDSVAGIVPMELQGIAPHVADDAEGQARASEYIDGLLDRLRERAKQAGAALRSGGDPLDTDEEDDA